MFLFSGVPCLAVKYGITFFFFRKLSAVIMGLDQFVDVFSNAALTAAGATGDIADHHNCMQGYCSGQLFLLIEFCLLCLDAGTNLWQSSGLTYSYASTPNYYNITNPDQLGFLYNVVNLLPVILQVATLTIGIRIGLLIQRMLMQWKLGKSEWSYQEDYLSNRRRNLDSVAAKNLSSNKKALEEAIVAADIIGSSTEFLIEILCVSIAKLTVSFTSIAELQSMQTTSSQISNGITAALAVTEFMFLTRRTYRVYKNGTSSKCCKVILFTLLFIFQSVSVATSSYVFAISVGVVDIDVYDMYDFWYNFGIVGGIALGSILFSHGIMFTYHCCCSEPKQRGSRIAVSPA